VEGLVDRLLQCSDCGDSFLFTVQEQRFFREHDFAEPRRCRHCRDQRRSQHREEEEGGVYHAPEVRVPTPPPRPRSERPVSSARTAPPRTKTPRVVTRSELSEWRKDRTLFEATCSCCGRVALVPFRPAQGRPVFCRECFRAGASASFSETAPGTENDLPSVHQDADDEPLSDA